MTRAEILIEAERRMDGRVFYRAELWERPDSGQMHACTRWVKTKATAIKDAKRIFRHKEITR